MQLSDNCNEAVGDEFDYSSSSDTDEDDSMLGKSDSEFSDSEYSYADTELWWSDSDTDEA